MSPAPSTADDLHSGPLADISRLRLAIVRLARRQRQRAGTGLTPSLQSALAMVDKCGPMTLGELAALEQVSAPTTTRIVDKLQEMALVVRAVDPDDRRVARVSMTDIGRKQLEESRERRDRWLRDRLAALDPADATAIMAAIEPLEHLLDIDDERDDRHDDDGRDGAAR